MFGCPSCLDTPHMLNATICLNTLLYVWVMFGCPLYIHNTWKACYVTLRGCPYAPYIWMPHMCGYPHIFECLPVCWDTPICFDAPSVCLDAPMCLDAPPVCLDVHMFGCPHVWMFGHSLYVWIMFGCPQYIHNTKKACFVTLRECPYVPVHLYAPCMFGCQSCLDTPICLDAPICVAAILNFCHFLNFKYFIHFSKYSFVLDVPICVAAFLNFCHFVFFLILNIFILFSKYSFEFWGNLAKLVSWCVE